MAGFTSQAVEFNGTLTFKGRFDEIFGLFSPEGERLWVPGWNPELLYPHGVAWAKGQIFRTQEGKGEAVWIVTALDRDRGHAEYHRVEPGRYVARVRVQCSAGEAGDVSVSVAYKFIGLSASGNGEIAAMEPGAYAEKMARWKGWIDAYLAKRAG